MTIKSKRKENDGIDLALQQAILQALLQAAIQICGGSFPRLELSRMVNSSVSFLSAKDKKPHNVEIRMAIRIFHQKLKYERQTMKNAKGNIGSLSNPLDSGLGINMKRVELVSDFGLSRSVSSPLDIARLIDSVMSLDWNVQVNSSGIIFLVTQIRAMQLRKSGKLPCPSCPKWCNGEKGLWWHQQQVHGMDHCIAVEKAMAECTSFSVVPYVPNKITCDERNLPPTHLEVNSSSNFNIEDKSVFESCRTGNLQELQRFILGNRQVDVNAMFDAKGATMLHWAAGYGKLNVVKFLVDQCKCDVLIGQRGTRSFAGRTALHWAARKGHVDVVRFLVETSTPELLNATTNDGTTAFAWACWQGHLDVMKYLKEKGCCVHSKNSFGCNAVLWCAQGCGNLESMKFLSAIDGMDMTLVNTNGHGSLHKAAQRGQDDVVKWLVHHENNLRKFQFSWIGPDSDDCCPSDLAGMEGYYNLAEELVAIEKKLLETLYQQKKPCILDWWKKNQKRKCKFSSHVWEPGGGVRRFYSVLDQLLMQPNND